MKIRPGDLGVLGEVFDWAGYTAGASGTAEAIPRDTDRTREY